MNELDILPVFRSDTLAQLGAYLSERVPPNERAEIVIEPSAADDLPGRRIVCKGEPLCRVVPDPSDPRPLPIVVRRFIDAAAAAVSTV